MLIMTYYESKINSRLRTYYRIHLIAGGNITGKVLEECSNLTFFGHGDTRISGSLPVYFGKLKRIRTLSIYTTMVSSEILL